MNRTQMRVGLLALGSMSFLGAAAILLADLLPAKRSVSLAFQNTAGLQPPAVSSRDMKASSEARSNLQSGLERPKREAAFIRPQSASSAFGLSGPIGARTFFPAEQMLMSPEAPSAGPIDGKPAGGFVKSGLDLARSLEDRGVSIRGVSGANSLLDGPIGDDVSEELDDSGNSARLPKKSAARLPNGKPAIFDVSEGTVLDPLADKTWDLNSAKSVPDHPAEPRSTPAGIIAAGGDRLSRDPPPKAKKSTKQKAEQEKKIRVPGEP